MKVRRTDLINLIVATGHPLRFSTTANGSHGGGSEYTTGVSHSGTPGSSGAYVQITVAASAPTLYYYCTNHSGMGGTEHAIGVKRWLLVEIFYAHLLSLSFFRRCITSVVIHLRLHCLQTAQLLMPAPQHTLQVMRQADPATVLEARPLPMSVNTRNHSIY